jgi:hypothetical protein
VSADSFADFERRGIVRSAGVHALDGAEAWLLGQDVAVEFQARRDLLGEFEGWHRRCSPGFCPPWPAGAGLR